MLRNEKNSKKKVTGKHFKNYPGTAVPPDFTTDAVQQAEQEVITENSVFPGLYSENLLCREKFPELLNQAGDIYKIKVL